jgi:ribosomal protein S18 acetylase RimI-like enzyme
MLSMVPALVTVIRRAAVDDAQAIASLSTQLGYPTSADAVRMRLTAALARADNEILVAVTDKAVVGWLHIYGVHTLESASHAEIAGLVVDEKHRGRRIGEALMAEAEKWAVRTGYRDVYVRSNVIRERAHRFYARLGYREVKRQSVLMKDL